MATFEIEGKEYELKLTYASVKHLNGLFEGGAYEIIGKALASDLDAFPKIIHAALFHTGENLALSTVEQAIEQSFENESLAFDDITTLLDKVVTQSFFFEATVKKMVTKNPELAQALEQIRS